MKYKVIFTAPENDRQTGSVVLDENQHRDFLSDMASAKMGEPIQLPGYGLISKRLYKTSTEVGDGNGGWPKYIGMWDWDMKHYRRKEVTMGLDGNLVYKDIELVPKEKIDKDPSLLYPKKKMI